MRNILTICLVLVVFVSYSQSRPKQDVYSQRIVATYEIVNGKTTGNSYAKTQFILDSLGRCHTEIDYDLSSAIKSYRWISFTGKNKLTVQNFIGDKLVEVDSFVYNNNGGLIKKFLSFPSDLGRVSYVENYSYKNNLLNSIVATTSKNKTVFNTTFKYDSHGSEISRKVKTRIGLPLDSIVKLNRTVEYDSLGRVFSEKTEKVVGGEVRQDWVTYKYNKKGQVNEKIFLGDGKKILSRIEFLYRDDNSLWQEKVYDANGILVKMEAWRSEKLSRGAKSGITVSGK